MAGSPFFARIKGDVATVVCAVPRGRLITFKDVGLWLDVQPRHFAYILSQLQLDEQARVPWHRAVPEDGTLRTAKANAFNISQRALLADEGVAIAPDGRIVDLARCLISIANLDLDLPPQRRPLDAPVSGSRRSPKQAGD